MPKAIIVTTNVEQRYRGLLSSHCLEVDAGVYFAPDIQRSVLEQIIAIMREWWVILRKGSILVLADDRDTQSGLRVTWIGTPRRDIIDYDGIMMVRRELL